MVKFISNSLLTYLIVFSTQALADIGWAQFPTSKVQHLVKYNETPWFLAQVYYGKGDMFEKIIAANHMNGLEDFKEGMTIEIPDAKYSPNEKNFKTWYSELKKHRSYLLSLKRKNQDTEVVKYDDVESEDSREPASVPRNDQPNSSKEEQQIQQNESNNYTVKFKAI